MSRRSDAKTTFLAQVGWAGAQVAPLAGDASNRSYDRVSHGHRKAVLMDAPPERGERTDLFVAIAGYLEETGLHPPALLGADPKHGFLLLEDLGDDLFARAFVADPGLQLPLYTEALAVLRHLHQANPADVPAYGPAEMVAALDLAAIWYAQDASCLSDLAQPMSAALNQLDWSRSVTLLRDYHAENLIWCPTETGLRRVGLLDFQDACLGHPLFDVASLLQDARRDVPDTVAETLKTETWDWFADSRPAFDLAFATLSAQRALRILGVFARLSLSYGKQGYVDLIPRVWTHLQAAVAHPALTDLAQAVEASLPPPTPEHLNTLKAKVDTCPAG